MLGANTVGFNLQKANSEGAEIHTYSYNAQMQSTFIRELALFRVGRYSEIHDPFKCSYFIGYEDREFLREAITCI